MDEWLRIQGMAGHIFPEVPSTPQPIRPESWLNDPRHTEFAEVYSFALDRFKPLAAKAFQTLTPEQVYIVWKTVETARAGLQRRWVVERYRG